MQNNERKIVIMSGKAEKWWTYTKNVLDYKDLNGFA